MAIGGWRDELRVVPLIATSDCSGYAWFRRWCSSLAPVNGLGAGKRLTGILCLFAVQRRHVLQQRQSICIFGVNPVRGLVALTFASDQVNLAQPADVVGGRGW
jgi:hypothetical protein